MGGDPEITTLFLALALVSIHAPAWGATLRQYTAPPYARCFYPRPRVGGDLRLNFQVRHIQRVSIHAPAWGATPSAFRRRPSRCVSIHAPAWGATTRPIRESCRRRGFYPRPRVGGDLTGAGPASRAGLFLSTPPRGGRQGMVKSTKILGDKVSIHAPAWGATM